jgi:hypothetical protein
LDSGTVKYPDNLFQKVNQVKQNSS